MPKNGGFEPQTNMALAHTEGRRAINDDQYTRFEEIKDATDDLAYYLRLFERLGSKEMVEYMSLRMKFANRYWFLNDLQSSISLDEDTNKLLERFKLCCVSVMTQTMFRIQDKPWSETHEFYEYAHMLGKKIQTIHP